MNKLKTLVDLGPLRVVVGWNPTIRKWAHARYVAGGIWRSRGLGTFGSLRIGNAFIDIDWVR
jgi:hypothetical protein